MVATSYCLWILFFCFHLRSFYLSIVLSNFFINMVCSITSLFFCGYNSPGKTILKVSCMWISSISARAVFLLLLQIFFELLLNFISACQLLLILNNVNFILVVVNQQCFFRFDFFSILFNILICFLLLFFFFQTFCYFPGMGTFLCAGEYHDTVNSTVRTDFCALENTLQKSHGSTIITLRTKYGPVRATSS